MAKKFYIKINNKNIQVKEGEILLDVALRNNIDIPHLCYHPDLKTRGNCRLCIVKIKGQENFVTSCTTQVEEGMEVITESPQLKRARKFNLELIFGEHVEDCPTCVWHTRCNLLKYRKTLNSKMLRFFDRKVKHPIYEFGPIIFDQTKCIDCRNCIEVCPTNFLEIEGRGSEIQIKPTDDKNKDCIYCGQCIMHCPAGAIKSSGEYKIIEELEQKLQDKNKIVVVQFAPSIRVTIGEEFGKEYGFIATNHLVGALRNLGFSYVFDTSVGADFTTYEEAQESIERIKTGKNLPIFTSCCPSWVKYIEFYRPDLMKHLSTARSPEIMLGGILKTYWAKKMKFNPEDIISVSVMPCVSKKYEASRKEYEINGLKPVDYVITTRELSHWLLNKKINWEKIQPIPADNPFGEPSGAGVVYGASGGVVESALRTAYFLLTGKNIKNINLFKSVRGSLGIKQASIKLTKPLKTEKGKREELKVIVVNELKNAKIILEELDKKNISCDCLEVMICPGGCIGGGGQPLPVNEKIRQKRAQSLYEIDKTKKIRFAHENPIIKEAYQEFFKDNKNRHKVLHTTYTKKPKTNILKRRRLKSDGALDNRPYKK